MKTMKKYVTKLAVLLIALSLLLSLCACTVKENPAKTNENATQEDSAGTEEMQVGLWENALYQTDTELGEGNLCVKVKVKADEKSITFTIHTNKTNLAEILLEHELVKGEDGAYGLYIKEVNGILADYDVDQTYWSVEQKGEALMSGVSGITVTNGDEYELVRAR